VLILKSGIAESRTRLEKRLLAIQKVVPAVRSLNASFVYLVDCNKPLTRENIEILKDLLGIQVSAVESDHFKFLQQLTVIPRFGTVSPWATKATEIAQRCDLQGINRIERGVIWSIDSIAQCSLEDIVPFIHDPMTQSVVLDDKQLKNIFQKRTARPLQIIEIIRGGLESFHQINQEFSLALTNEEMEYLIAGYRHLGRDPTDAELMMFAQVNSEHCRHKLFNTFWEIDGIRESSSMFQMIQSTHEIAGEGTIVAYNDNAAVLEGSLGSWFFPNEKTQEYGYSLEPMHIVAKVETHNHPTGISPFPGAATGSGGEIRDEGATGRGGWPKAGITGFSVSNLNLPGAKRPWELNSGYALRLAKPLEIMIEGPIGAASFNNEFGRPNIGGYFRTLEIIEEGSSESTRRGYHKPVMLAGGLGNIRKDHIKKNKIPAGAHLIILGGPGMLIGLGGGAASSLESGISSEELDFASVQRGNPEMERRCQEVINACIALGVQNPILSIHDVGAGGLCNALPELVEASNIGGIVDLAEIPNDDHGMSPMEIWCNESQERYVIAISKDKLQRFSEVCDRESCPYSVVGTAVSNRNLLVRDDRHIRSMGNRGFSPEKHPVDISMDFLFTNELELDKTCNRELKLSIPLNLSQVTLEEAIDRVIQLPAIADKSFLINIGDRSVGGRVVRDPMVGPWQVPVADVGVTSSGFMGVTGECVAVGERAPIALIDPVASGHIAVAESITNIIAASVPELTSVKLSANWMACADFGSEQASLYDMVRSVTNELCPKLGISIPVGKDSLSMSSRWQEGSHEREVISPITLVVTAFAPVSDIHKIWTPMLHRHVDSVLLFVDLANGKTRLAGSALAQVFNQLGSDPPNVESAELIQGFFKATRQMIKEDLVLAYHDRSDGGLIVTLLEMAFAGRVGLEIDIEHKDPLKYLFNEELGAVFEIETTKIERTFKILRNHGLYEWATVIGRGSSSHNNIIVKSSNKVLFQKSRIDLHRSWSETSWRIQSLRDEPECADQEYNRFLDQHDPGLHSSVSVDVDFDDFKLEVGHGLKPRIAILREQGINGHIEMAAAFDLAGFSAQDVTMTDLISGRNTLGEFDGIVVCGGFSFGDVLGAGLGWAKSILYRPHLRNEFTSFFNRYNTFTLGVCNGCQMLSGLRELIPGSKHWPYFIRNKSDQFESRLVMVEVLKSNSILFGGLEGAKLPIVVAHGEGKVKFSSSTDLDQLENHEQISIRYVDNYGLAADNYPSNPNGSQGGLTGFCNEDGRVTIMMPHPERVVRSINCSWYPDNWGEFSPWLKVFQNARHYCD
jgi:phosphoribosylformylglycinamidine synthase